MYPVINLRETGINLRRIMDKRGITAKDVQKYLNLASVQSVYNWWSGINMPTLSNLYALSHWLQIPMDDMVRGSRPALKTESVVIADPTIRRLYAYYEKINKVFVA